MAELALASGDGSQITASTVNTAATKTASLMWDLSRCASITVNVDRQILVDYTPGLCDYGHISRSYLAELYTVKGEFPRFRDDLAMGLLEALIVS